MSFWERTGSWLLQNLLWEVVKPLGVAIVATVMARIGIWIFGPKKVPRPKEVAFWTTGILGGTLLLVLTYSAFVLSPGQSGARSGRPDLHCGIMQADCGVTKYNDGYEEKSITGVILWARIINNGAPSSAWNWHLKARLVSGVAIDSDRMQKPVLVFDPGHGKQPITLDAGQYLPWQLMDTPLANGASKTGWIGFIFDASLFDELKRPGVKLFLEFEDVEGKTISSPYTPSMGWSH